MTMKTKAHTLARVWLLVVTIGVLSNNVFAVGDVQQEQQRKSEITDASAATVNPNRDNHHTTLNISTTASWTKPIKKVVKTSLTLPTFELNGCHAIINNEFMADQQTKVHNTTTALYNIIHKQMASILSNSKSMGNLPKDRLEKKESIVEGLGAPVKPLFSHALNNFNDYDEYNENGDELTEQEEQQNENCEDTEESLTENDDDIITYGKEAAAIKHPTNVKANTDQNLKISEKIFYNQNTSSVEKQPTKNPNVQSNNHNIKEQSTMALIIKKPSTQSQPAISYNQPPLTPEISRPFQILQYLPELKYVTPLGNRIGLPSPAITYPIVESLKKPPAYSSLIFHNHHGNPTKAKETPYAPLQPSESYGFNNSYTNLASPFSSSSNSPSGRTAPKKRNLPFRTISSSTQLVSTPLGNLMLKLVVGMALKDKNYYSERQTSYDENVVEVDLYK